MNDKETKLTIITDMGIVLQSEYSAPKVKGGSPLAGKEIRRIFDKYSTPKLEKIKKRLLPF